MMMKKRPSTLSSDLRTNPSNSDQTNRTTMMDNKQDNGIKFYQILSIFMAILASIDSIYHLVLAKKDDWTSILPESPTEREQRKLLITMWMRLCISVVFIVLEIFGHKRLRWPMTWIAIIYSMAITVLLIVCCSFLRFKYFGFSLVTHLLNVFFAFLSFFDRLFRYYRIDSDSSVILIDSHDEIDKKKLLTIRKFLLGVKKNMLPIGTFSMVILALIVGIVIRQNDPGWNERHLMYVGFIGELFLRILKCLVLPLIFTSLVFAIGNMDSRLSGRIASRAVIFYLSTTVMAVIIGIILVVLIKPGMHGEIDQTEELNQSKRYITTVDTILDLFRNIFPENIIQACFELYSTNLNCPNKNLTNTNCTIEDLNQWKIDKTMSNGSNFLGIVTFAAVFGIVISRIAERSTMVDFFHSFNSVIMGMTTQVIYLTPIAVTFLVLPQIIKVKDLNVMFGSIGFYFLTVVVGIVFQAVGSLPLIYFLTTRKNPFLFIKHLYPALITAFGTSSSSATMPITFQCLEQNAKLDSRIVRFCIPIGSTINMDGTALYEAVAAIFIAQYRNIHLEFIQMIIVTITATAASIGAAGIPQAGLVTMVIVLNAVGLNAEDAVLVLVVDWLLDRLRTTLNVLGDAIGSGIVDHLSRNEIEQFDAKPAIEESINGSETSYETTETKPCEESGKSIQIAMIDKMAE